MGMTRKKRIATRIIGLLVVLALFNSMSMAASACCDGWGAGLMPLDAASHGRLPAADTSFEQDTEQNTIDYEYPEYIFEQEWSAFVMRLAAEDVVQEQMPAFTSHADLVPSRFSSGLRPFLRLDGGSLAFGGVLVMPQVAGGTRAEGLFANPDAAGAETVANELYGADAAEADYDKDVGVGYVEQVDGFEDGGLADDLDYQPVSDAQTAETDETQYDNGTPSSAAFAAAQLAFGGDGIGGDADDADAADAADAGGASTDADEQETLASAAADDVPDAGGDASDSGDTAGGSGGDDLDDGEQQFEQQSDKQFDAAGEPTSDLTNDTDGAGDADQVDPADPAGDADMADEDETASQAGDADEADIDDADGDDVADEATSSGGDEPADDSADDSDNNPDENAAPDNISGSPADNGIAIGGDSVGSTDAPNLPPNPRTQGAFPTYRLLAAGFGLIISAAAVFYVMLVKMDD